jgi:hypothetical protein
MRKKEKVLGPENERVPLGCMRAVNLNRRLLGSFTTPTESENVAFQMPVIQSNAKRRAD